MVRRGFSQYTEREASVTAREIPKGWEGEAMRAFIYTRVTSEEQVSNLSLDVQKKTCRDYCTRND